METQPLVTLADIEAAGIRISGYVLETPLVPVGEGPYLKAETLQLSGAFKLRGAFNALLRLHPKQAARGVIAPSSGNHALAVACAASHLGITATVVMPGNTPSIKRAAPASWGAHVEVHGETGADSMAWAIERATLTGQPLIHPFDSVAIIEATGTIGLELMRQGRDLQRIYVPVSGGGLISGIAAAVKATRPDVQVIGVEPELADDAAQSFRCGQRVVMDPRLTARTIADGLRTMGLGLLPWRHIAALVDDIVTVSEDEILSALSWTWRSGRLVAEPSGAVAVAAARRDADPARTAAIVSGANVDPSLLLRVSDPAARHELTV